MSTKLKKSSKKPAVNDVSPAEKARIVLEAFSGKKSIAEICRDEGIARNTFERWKKTFVEGGQEKLGSGSVQPKPFAETDNEFLQLIMEAFPGNLLISKLADGEVLFRSPSSKKRFGDPKYTSNQWVDQDARASFIDELKRLKRVDNVPMAAIGPDGKPFLTQFSSSLINYRGEQIVLSSSTDMSEANALREELEHANARFHEALEAFDEGFVLWDSDFKLVLENQRMFDMLYPEIGPPRVAQPGDDFYLVLTEQFENGVYKKPEGVPVEQVIEMWKHMVMAYTKNVDIELADGRILSGSSHETAFGNYLLTFKDVTQIRAAEKAEREANMLLKTIVEACPTTFLVSRLDDGEIIYYPPASRDRFGDIQSTLEFFLKPEDRVAYLNALMPDGVLDDYPVKFRRRDGTIMQGLTSARVADYNGEDVIVSATRDITDQIAMEAELERERNRAHQNEKLSALGELLAGVAHELNNPLSIVVGYSLMLQDKIDDPVQKQRVERIGQAAERCAKIVKMFLAMARQGPLQIETCSLNDVLETVVDVVKSNLNASDVQLKLELNPDLPNVEVDPDQIAQVFTNLIMNAENELSRKPDDRRIKIISTYDENSGNVIVKIRDNGGGIPGHIQRRIFEPFFTTKESGVGTGVGLALSHRIVTSHNGTLSVHSLEGKGATFFVRLKAVDQTALAIDETVETADQAISLNICVVDDEIGVTTLISDILEEAGHAATVANDPLKALELLKSTQFDLVLCDMKMPGMNGQEFYNQAVSEDPAYAQKFAFITGDTMSASVAEFFHSLSVPYFEKPIVPDDFVAFVTQFPAFDGDKSHD